MTLAAPVRERPAGEGVVVSIGASEVILSVKRPEGLSARNVVPARLAGLDVEGGRAYATLDTGVLLVAELTQDAVQELGLTLGQHIYAVFKSSSIAVLDA